MNDHFEISLLDEPKIEFGQNFICDDPKVGIGVGGFFSNSNNSHRSQINIAVISTEQLVTDTLHWISQFENRIVASAVTLKEKYSSIEDGEITDEDESDNEEFEELFNEKVSVEDERTVEEQKVINKKYNPDFIGFSHDSPLQCAFQNNSANNRFIKDRDFDRILQNGGLSAIEKLDKVIDLFVERFQDLIDNKVSAVD